MRARRLNDELKFEEARAAYEQAANVRLASTDEVVAAYQGLGIAAATLGDEAAAREAFLRLLALRPDARLEGSDISPRQRAPFEAAQRFSKDKGPLRLEHDVAPSWPIGEPVAVRVDVSSDWLALVAGVRLNYRRAPGAYQELAATGRRPYEILVPASPSGGVEYFLEAVDRHGCPLSTLGSADAPLRVAVVAAEAPGAPLHRRPWLWVVVGALVAAGATALVVSATRDATYRVETRPPP